MTHRLRILHLSDLHERVALPGMAEERLAKIRLGAARRVRVLENNFLDVLKEIRVSGPIDVICFTGDVADWGLGEEYASAELRIRQILEATQVALERLFLIPGNHDVHRPEASEAWQKMRELAAGRTRDLSDWMGGCTAPNGAESIWREEILKRTATFWNWVGCTLGRTAILPQNNPHQYLGYRATLPDLPFPMHIIGLDSAWLAGDDNDAKKLVLTDGQINRLARDANGRHLSGFRLALMHHSLSDLHDGSKSKLLLSETVDLLLYGHQHEPAAEVIQTPDGGLQTIAAGSLYEGDHGDCWVNGFNVIDAELDSLGQPLRYNLEFWGWSEQGHWHRNSAIYREAKDGRIVLWTPRGRSEQANNTPISFAASASSQQSLVPASVTASCAPTVMPPAVSASCTTVAARTAVPAQVGDRSSPFASSIAIEHLAAAQSLLDLGRSLDIPLAVALQVTRRPVPPPLPSGYVPRPNVLSDLDNWLNTYPVVAVIGYEECGKTAVVAEFSNNKLPCFWYSLPPEIGDCDSNIVGMLLALQVFLNAQSICPADLENALDQFLQRSPLLIVIDNAHSLGTMDAIEFLFQIAAANNQLRILLLGTDQPEFLSWAHKSAIFTWRLPGMTSDQAVALFNGLGIEMIPVRIAAATLLRDHCDGHVGMLRLLANTIGVIVNERVLAQFISQLSGVVSGNAAQFYAALMERFRQSLTTHELQLCRRLAVARHPFRERLARALWLDGGEQVDFPIAWNQCVASIFESHDIGRFSIPSLYQRGLMSHNAPNDVKRWHNIAASTLGEPEHGVVDLFDICDSIWHYVLAENHDTAIRRACGILAIANHDRREDIVAYLLKRFAFVIHTCLDNQSVTRQTRVLWYSMRTSFCQMVRQRKEADQAATALAALLKKPPRTGWTQGDLRAWAVLLMYASRTGQTDIAVRAYKSLSPAVFVEWDTEAKGVPVFLALSAFIVANRNPLPFVYELLCSPSRFAFPLADLWSLPQDYELWRTVASMVYLAIDSKAREHVSVDKDLRSLLKSYQAAQRASLNEVAVVLGACLVRLYIDIRRDYDAAVELGRSIDSISSGLDSRIHAHAKHTLGDALRCQQHFALAVTRYAEALTLWHESDVSDRAQTMLLLGIAESRDGNPLMGWHHACEAAQIYNRSSSLWQKQAEACLEGFVMALQAGRYPQAMRCLIKAHSLLCTHRQCPEWIAIAQCAMSLVSPMGTFMVSDSPPMPGFTLGLPATVPGADKMWAASPTAMLGRACGALGRPYRGLKYLESALSEATSPDLQNLTSFFCLELALSVHDIERATVCAIHASGMPRLSIPKGDMASFDVFLCDHVVARTIGLASDLSLTPANMETLTAVIAKAATLEEANTPVAQLLLTCLAAFRDTTATSDDTILDTAYAAAIDRKTFQVARNLAWWWCFRFHPGRPASVDKVTQWHWRLTWLTLRIGKTDATFLRGFLSQEMEIWRRLQGADSDSTVKGICDTLSDNKSDASSGVADLSGFLGSELTKVTGVKHFVCELTTAIRNMPDAASLSPAIRGAVARLLDIVLMPGALTMADEIAEAIEGLVDAIGHTDSIDGDTRTTWSLSMQGLYRLFHAIRSQSPTQEAFEALVSFADLTQLLSPTSEANWYIALRHLFGAAKADRAVFKYVMDSLRSQRVEQLLVHPKVPQYLRRRLAVCHAVAHGHHAIACLLSACMTRGIQSLGGIPYSYGAVVQGKSEFKNAVEIAVAATTALDKIEHDLRDEGCSHMDVWSCCHERAGLRKFVGAMLLRQMNMPKEGNEWLRKSMDDFRLATKVAVEYSEARNVLNSAKEARTVAVFLQDTSATEEFSGLVADVCRQLAIDPSTENVSEMDANDPLLVATKGEHREASWPTDEMEMHEYSSSILTATGLPEDRRRSIEDDIRKQGQIEKVQREFCRYLQPLQNREHLGAPATAYLYTTKYTCSCQLLGHETRIENDDLDVVIKAMQQVYCSECDRREPRA